MATNFRSSCYLVLQLFCLLLAIHVCKSEDGDTSDTDVTNNNMPTSDSESDVNDNEEDSRDKLPTVFIPILARNKAHALPTFFAYLDRLNYPKDRISIWIRTDHSEDNTTYILYEWAVKVQHFYHRLDFNYSLEPTGYEGENGPYDWTDERFNHLIHLREEALMQARYIWADYLFTVDVDNFLQNPDVLRLLIQQNKTLIAPMLNSLTMYSNFWAGVNLKGYYKRTPEYVFMLRRNMTGLYEVPMIHSTYLLNLRHRVSDKLSYVPTEEYIENGGDIDDMLAFKYSAEKAGIPMYLLNTEEFGRLLPPPGPKDAVYDESEKMLFLRLESMIEEYQEPLPVSEYISDKFPTPEKLGFDEIYMINLKRRPKRRKRMMATLKELGIAVKIFDAIDGKAMTTDDIKALGIDMLPGFKDPWAKRTLTKGEIGCFLSHYYIWQEVVEKGYEKILIIEDDVRFEYKYRAKMHYLFQEIEEKGFNWDLIYVGRKILRAKDEAYLNGSRILVHPSYSYWTLSYMLTQEGARKLLAQKPLNRMVPVDEYLPIMFNKHPRSDWASQFHPLDLVAYSVNPLFVFPTHYTGEPNYISDTETSGIWEEAKEKADKPTANGTTSEGRGREEKELRNVPSVPTKEESVSDSTEHTEL